jgi:hypothetical protein
MLEKLTTHDIQDVAELFTLADKCVRATEGRAWHNPPAPEAGRVASPIRALPPREVAAKIKTKTRTRRRTAATTRRWLELPPPQLLLRQVGAEVTEVTRAPVKRPTAMTKACVAQCTTLCVNAEECREIKKLVEQYRKHLKQQRDDGVPSHQREGKQKVDPEEDKDEGLGFQKVRRDLKAIFGHSDSESSDNERCKTLYVILGVLGISPPVASSRTCAKRWRRPHLSQSRRRTTSGWRRRSASTPLTAPRAWQGSDSSRCLSPQPSSTSNCTTSLSMVVQR